MDPILTACAYNAGGIYRQNGPNNRWKLRQYPIGTGHHADRFAACFNSAMMSADTIFNGADCIRFKSLLTQ
jgi:hypothetical protein